LGTVEEAATYETLHAASLMAPMLREGLDPEHAGRALQHVRTLLGTPTVAILDASGTLSAHLQQWSDDWTASFQNDGFATMLCPGWMLGIIEGNAAGVTGWDIADTFPGGGGNWGLVPMVPNQWVTEAEARRMAEWILGQGR
jgi:hypothetical protein